MLIAISGKIGAGKDTLADLLIELEPRLEPESFGYKLKQICSLLTGVNVLEQLTREGKRKFLPEWGMTVGEMQQRVGTDAIRNNLHIDAWVLALFADYVHGQSFWVITDCRFPNEAQAVLSRGGLVVRIDGSRTGPQGRDPFHISETALDDFDGFSYRFTNDGTMEDLMSHAKAILSMAESNSQ